MLKKNTVTLTFAQHWEKYNADVLTYRKLATNLIVQHNDLISVNIVNHQSISVVEELLKTLSNIQIDLDKYTSLSLKRLRTEIESKTIQSEIKDCKIQVIDRSIQLNKILSNKYLYRYDLEKNVEMKLLGLKKSYDLIKYACDLKESYINDLGEDYDPTLNDTMIKICEAYNWFVTTSISTSTSQQKEINRVINQARKAKSPDDAFNKFQEAFNLSKASNDYLQQFQIAFEQGDNYIKAHANVITNFLMASGKTKDIEHIIKCINKGCSPLIFTIELMLSNQITGIPIVTHTHLCNTMYQAADILLSIVSNPNFSNNTDRKQALLTDAISYYQWGENLSTIVKTDLTQYAFLEQVISNSIKIIEIEKNEQIQENLKKEKRELELQISVSEYNDNFPLLLNSVTDNKPTKNKKGVGLSKLPTNIIEHDDVTDLSDEEPLNKIDKSSDNTSKPTNYPFDLNNMMNELDVAKKNNDIHQQAYIAFQISEYYCILCKGHFKGEYLLDKKIEYLQTAISYLLLASNKIHLMKNEAHRYEITQLEKWTVILLQDCENLLNDSLIKQKNLQLQLQTNRDKAKEAIINKSGPEAWYKNNPRQSSHTKELKLTNIRVKLLLRIQDNVTRAKRNLNLAENVVNQPIPIVNHENSMYHSPFTHFKSSQQQTRQKATRQRSVSLDPKIMSHMIRRNTNS